MCFFEDGRISTLCVHDDLIAILNIFDNYTHSSPAAERNNINQLIFILLIENLQLDDVLCLFDKFVPHLAGKVDEANFIWARALVFFLFGVADDIVTYDHTDHELMELRFSAEGLKVSLDHFPRVDLVFDGNDTKDHLIGCEGASFISKNAVDQSELLHYRRVEHSTMFLDGLIVEFAIAGEEDGGEGLDAFDEDVEGDGDEEVEQQEDGEEHEEGLIRRELYTRWACPDRP